MAPKRKPFKLPVRPDELRQVPARVAPRSATVSFVHTQINKRLYLSTCSTDEIKAALGALRKLSSLTWEEIFQTGRKGANKTGLNCEKIPRLKIPRPAEVSEDVTILSIRASERFRILGYRDSDAFRVLWFDPLHSSYDG